MNHIVYFILYEYIFCTYVIYFFKNDIKCYFAICKNIYHNLVRLIRHIWFRNETFGNCKNMPS